MARPKGWRGKGRGAGGRRCCSGGALLWRPIHISYGRSNSGPPLASPCRRATKVVALQGAGSSGGEGRGQTVCARVCVCEGAPYGVGVRVGWGVHSPRPSGLSGWVAMSSGGGGDRPGAVAQHVAARDGGHRRRGGGGEREEGARPMMQANCRVVRLAVDVCGGTTACNAGGERMRRAPAGHRG
eukprot:scaffold11747_cov90-Isochrysis_galbana.AAC.2